MSDVLIIAQALSVDVPEITDAEVLVWWERYAFETIPPDYTNYVRPLTALERTPEATAILAGANACLVAKTASGECSRKYCVAFTPTAPDPVIG